MRIEISALKDNPEEAAKKVMAALHEGNEAIITNLPYRERRRAYEVAVDLAVYEAEDDGMGANIRHTICGDDNSSLLFSLV